jgi:sec-independent protein translocase protein TatA
MMVNLTLQINRFSKERHAMFSGLFQPLHLIIILVIVVIIFGAGKLPEIGDGLAKGIKSFKKGMADIKDEKDEPSSKPSENKEEKKS